MNNACANMNHFETKVIYSGLTQPNPANWGQLGDLMQGIKIGDLPDTVRIGDNPDWIPGPTYVPNPNAQIWPSNPIVPIGSPYQHTTGYLQIVPSYWRNKIKGEWLELSCDMPGIALSDIKVEIDGLTLKASGVRGDTKENVLRTWTLPDSYDPVTAQASLENGVLFVMVKRYESSKPRRIEVPVK